MRLAFKMTLCIVALAALLLSLCGGIMVQKNFDDSLTTFIESSTQTHLQQKYTVEWQMLTLDTEQSAESYIASEAAKGVALANSTSTHLALYVDDNLTVFSNLPLSICKTVQLDALKDSDEKWRIINADDESYLLLTTPLYIPNKNYKLISSFDASPLFAARAEQLKTLLYISLCALALAFVLAYALSRLLTRPLDKLEAASRKIAQGDVTERTGIKSSDEIGSLSASFDAMAASVQDKIASLNSSVREREDFVSAFTHELKTPMTSMLGYAALLRAKQQTPEIQRTAADYIYHETKRLEQLSQKLMLLMGLKNEQMTLAPLSLDAVFTAISKALPQKDSAVKVKLEKCGLFVMGDAVLIEDMLRNLIVNAQHACREGGSVTVGAEKQGDKCRLFVKDTGCGIAKGEIAKITEPFYMVDKSRARAENGSGMGLALCSRIAQLHGSELSIKSEVGKGTQISVMLPLAKANAKEADND